MPRRNESDKKETNSYPSAGATNNYDDPAMYLFLLLAGKFFSNDVHVLQNI